MDVIDGLNIERLLELFFNAAAAIAFAYTSRQSYKLKRLTLENQEITIASKQISEGNAKALVEVTQMGKDNADAIEHTRAQNVKLATQQDNLAEQVGHVHICVETRVADLKAVVERVPDAVKEAVPEAIKEVLPDVIKETVPPVVEKVVLKNTKPTATP